ncbi:MAG TPA: gluconokinase [Terriglobales bacterium]
MIVIVMGVAGAGKTTIGRLLADALGWQFEDADSYHSPENVQKMAAGIPLTDADRAPWLESLRSIVQSWVSNNQSGVLACSALKQSYRERLQVSPRVRIVYLRGPIELIRERMNLRAGHYMKPELLQSQFDTLEEPADAVVADASGTPAEIVRQIRARLNI